MDKDNRDNNEKGIILANRMYTLCLEETVLSWDENGNVTDISKKDMWDDEFERVKSTMNSKLEWPSIYELVKNFDVTIYDIEKKQRPKTRKILSAEMQTRNNIIEMVKKIISTKKDVDRWYKRWNVEFIADEKDEYNWEITWVLKSRWHKVGITVKMKNDETIDYIKIKKLSFEFDDAMEWFRTANLINWIHKNAEDHPRWSDAPGPMWHLEYYHWSNWWDLERNVTTDMWPIWILGDYDNANDVDVIDKDTLFDYFYTIRKEEEFLEYINDFL